MSPTLRASLIVSIVLGVIAMFVYLGDAGFFEPDEVVRVDTVVVLPPASGEGRAVEECPAELTIEDSETVGVSHVDLDNDGLGMKEVRKSHSDNTRFDGYRSCSGSVVILPEGSRGYLIWFGED